MPHIKCEAEYLAARFSCLLPSSVQIATVHYSSNSPTLLTSRNFIFQNYMKGHNLTIYRGAVHI